MERFFTAKIYSTVAGVDSTCIAECVDIHITPYSIDLTVDEVALYWKRYILRCPAFDSGSYIVAVSLTRYPVKSFVEVHKSLKK